MQGLILKGVGGFYTVETPEGDLLCRARGLFRREAKKPLPGDSVSVSGLGGGEGSIDEIMPRKNALVRPAMSNVDLMFIVASAAPPTTAPLIIDKMAAVCAHKGIDCVICLNKTDIDPGAQLRDIYVRAGFRVIESSAVTGAGMESVKELIRGRMCAFAGQSGVGKSSIMNLLGAAQADVGGLSEKIGRGRHTTRHTEFFHAAGGYIADTPGFGDLAPGRFERIRKEDLPAAFREFSDYIDDCQFAGCSHTCEKGCAVLAAVGDGRIPRSRHESYCIMYDEAKNIKDWQQ